MGTGIAQTAVPPRTGFLSLRTRLVHHCLRITADVVEPGRDFFNGAGTNTRRPGCGHDGFLDRQAAAPAKMVEPPWAARGQCDRFGTDQLTAQCRRWLRGMHRAVLRRPPWLARCGNRWVVRLFLAAGGEGRHGRAGDGRFCKNLPLAGGVVSLSGLDSTGRNRARLPALRRAIFGFAQPARARPDSFCECRRRFHRLRRGAGHF